MKKRHCPCCGEAISFKAFVKALFTFRKRNAFVEDEVGVLCPQCKKSIISAERKNRVFIPILAFSLLPFLFMGAAWEAVTAPPYGLCFLGYTLLTLAASPFLLMRTYRQITYLCHDENSDIYNRDMTYV
jgi:ribosomal protein S27AE